jgi:hypothetical protein
MTSLGECKSYSFKDHRGGETLGDDVFVGNKAISSSELDALIVCSRKKSRSRKKEVDVRSQNLVRALGVLAVEYVQSN